MTINNIYAEMFAKVTESAAISASKFRGKNDKISADQAAVDAMREELNLIKMCGKIVIGEGEMDEAPMLYINEKVGTNTGPEFDIAVDPLEGTNFTAKDLPNALAVIAISEKGNLLNAPDIYMKKIAVGPNLPLGIVDLDYSISKNINRLSEALKKKPDQLNVCLLKRPRHDSIVKSLNDQNVKINFITDGDVTGAISVGDPNKKIDMFIGTGGGPEGVLAAAALKCLDCQMQTQLVFENDEQKNRSKKMGIEDLNKKYQIKDMIKGDVIFCATGVTDGDFLKGVEYNKNIYSTETLILHLNNKTNKILNQP